MLSSSTNISSRSNIDRLLWQALRLVALLAGSLLLLVVRFVIHEAWPAFQHIGLRRFFTDPDWYPIDGTYRLTSMVWGTV